MTVIQQAQATENAYQAGRKAEGERQALEAAKKVEAARMLNQGQVGLAQGVAQPYVSGISQEDLYKLALVKQAQDANAKAAYDKQAIDNYNASRQHQDDARLLKKVGWDTPEAYAATVRSEAFDDRVDPGLAAKWMESYKGR